jgi:hypothetical protein
MHRKAIEGVKVVAGYNSSAVEVFEIFYTHNVFNYHLLISEQFFYEQSCRKKCGFCFSLVKQSFFNVLYLVGRQLLARRIILYVFIKYTFFFENRYNTL